MLSIFYLPTLSYSDNDEVLKQQQEEFGIRDFIENSKQYAGEFFEDIDIEDTLNSALQGKVDNSNILKRILNLLGSETLN